MLFQELLSGLSVLGVLIVINAFFVAAEYSLITSRKTRLQEMAAGGNTKARAVVQVMEDPDRFFAAAQLGIAATSLAMGSFAEEPLSNFFSEVLRLSRSPLLESASFVVGSIFGLGLAAYFQVVLAELVPRSLTMRHAERVALVLVPIMRLLAVILTPFTFALKWSSRFVLRLLGFNPNDASQRHYSVNELKMMVDESQRGGVIEVEAQAMLNAVFSFGDTTVREVMMPRTEVIGLDADATLADAVHTFSANTFNRILVYEGTLDKVLGVLHSRDLLGALLPETRKMTVRQLVREALVVPDTERADELLEQFRTRRESLAVVLDEYGGTAGLVTLTDLSARILGQVSDSDKDAAPEIQLTSDGAMISGLTMIEDVNDAFDLKLLDDNYDTIGGYVMGQLKRIPRQGDEIDLNARDDHNHHLILRVEAMDKLRVAKVRLLRREAANDAAAANTSADSN